IERVSNKIAGILNVDSCKVRHAIEEDIKKDPLDDDDIEAIQETDIDDEIINKMLDSMPDDLKAKFTQLDDGDGLC
ncbi:MAG: hypothetical protein GTO02_16745, partial [Candidatus Dadabacteria bacterium]|nr:hypothetical protein [Candidatus Dadabacteria bacterium]